MFTRWFSRRSILVFIRNCSLEGLFNNNDDDDLKVAHPQSGSSSTRFLIKLEFGNIGFWGEGKTGVSREKTARSKGENQQQTQPHIWRRRREMNPGHIGGRGKHSHHCAIPCSPPPCQKQYFYPPMLHALFAYLNMLICLFLFGNIQHPDHVRGNNYYICLDILQVDLSEESLLKQFEIVKRETNTSHVQKYGDMVSKLNNIWDFPFCTTDLIYTVITSSKPSVSHCDRMKRYSCRIGNSESNCWWKTGWLNRCLNCVHIDVQSPIYWRGAWLKSPFD